MILTLLNLYISGILNASLPALPIMEEMPTNKYSALLEVSPLPYQKNQSSFPSLEAKSILVTDLKTGTILYERRSEDKRPIGSITKLMTALIVLEENSLADIVEISERAARTEGSRIWLYPKEKITVGNLLYASLIHSANDATYALAEHNAGSVEKFIEKMDKKASILDLKSTKFSNPAGFDDPNNYSTAKDTTILSKLAYKKDFIRRAVNIKKMEVKSIDGKITHKLENTNNLLGKDPKIKGLKTGHTLEAGYSFVAVAENKTGNDIITVIFDSPARFKETQKLVDWIFDNFVW